MSMSYIFSYKDRKKDWAKVPFPYLKILGYFICSNFSTENREKQKTSKGLTQMKVRKFHAGIHHVHFESSLIELESSPVELKSSLIE